MMSMSPGFDPSATIHDQGTSPRKLLASPWLFLVESSQSNFGHSSLTACSLSTIMSVKAGAASPEFTNEKGPKDCFFMSGHSAGASHL